MKLSRLFSLLFVFDSFKFSFVCNSLFSFNRKFCEKSVLFNMTFESDFDILYISLNNILKCYQIC